MTLSQQHRTIVHQHLVPVFGEEVSEALMAELPTHDRDELVTKDHLEAELAKVRVEVAALGGELRTEMATLGGNLRTEMATLGGSLGKEMGSLRTEMGTLSGSLRTEMASLDGSLRDEMKRLHIQTIGTILTAVAVGTAVAAAFG